MKNLLFSLFLLIPLLLSTSCRDEKYVDMLKSTNYYYSKDKTKILYDSNINIMNITSSSDYKELSANADNFEVIKTDFGKDDKNIFYRALLLNDADYQTFCWDAKLDLPKDKNHIYLPTRDVEELPIIKYADPATYERVDKQTVCTDWYRDKNYYFYEHEKTEADRATLSFESIYMPYDNKHIFYIKDEELNKDVYVGKVVVVNPNLVHDDQKIYFQTGCDSINRRIPVRDIRTFRYHDTGNYIFEVDATIFIRGLKTLIDAATFVIVEFPYMKDKNKVYCNTEILEFADPNTFEILSYPYVKDKRNVYYQSKRLPDVDVATFVILDNSFAKDKNKVYQKWEELSGYKPAEFVKDKWGRYPSESGYGEAPKPRSSGSSRRWRDDD